MGEIRTFQGELRVKGKSENLKGVKEIYYKSILKVSLVNRTNLIKENVSEYSANYQNSVNIIDKKIRIQSSWFQHIFYDTVLCTV